VLLTVIAAVAGTFLATNQFLLHLKHLNQALDRGEPSAVPLLNLALLVLAITLLLLPGLISDVIAVLLLIPPIRYLAVSHILLRFNEYRNSDRHKPQRKPPDIIDI
jgi:UPF0716 protein FxsA